MAEFKCKMCGGELELVKGVSIVACPYCGTKQTVPVIDDDKKIRLYNRANQYRLDNEFDKAYSAYETIISDKVDEAEAYWGLVLSEYGVEYVEDPATKKRIPTCHRTLIKSVVSNENYKLACQYADSDSRMLYEDEAEELDSLQKKILNASAKEEPYDVFICYKESDENGERTADSVLAQEIYTELEKCGFRVFFSRITLEDKLGKDYEPCIYAALTSAKVMLMVTTDSDHCNAVWVKNEWKRYIDFMKTDKAKVLIPVYRDISPYTLPDEFSKLQAQDMSKLGAIQDLVRGVEKIVGKKTGNSQGLGEHEKSLLDRFEKSQARNKLLIKGALIVGATIILGLLFRNLSVRFFGFSPAIFYGPTYDFTIHSSIFRIAFAIGALTFDVGVFFNWIDGFKKSRANTIYIALMAVVSFAIIIADLCQFEASELAMAMYAVIALIPIVSSVITFLKNKKQMLCRIGAIVAAVAITSVFMFTAPKKGNDRNINLAQVEVTIDKLNIRSKASSHSDKLGFVERGEIYTVLDTEFVSWNEWYLIETKQGVRGYISSGKGAYTKVLPTNATNGNKRDESVPQVKITAKYINIRKIASVSSKIIGRAVKDEIYTVNGVEFDEQYIWYYITTADGKKGYIACDKNNPSLEELLPEGVNISEQSNVRNESVLQIKILSDSMNVRNSASTESNIVTQVEKGDIFTVLGIEYGDRHTWYIVETSLGYKGYIASGNRHEYVEYMAANGASSQQSNDVNFEVEQYEVGGSPVQLYSAPSMDSDVIGMLFPGEVYDILQNVVDEWGNELGWIKIKTNRNVTGYVQGWLAGYW